ncbi:hypothetical protein GCM10027265_30030 [Jatrophihabitans fulvus]
MITAQRPFSAATSKFAYAQAFSGSQVRHAHRVGLRARLAARRTRRPAA